MFAPFFISFYTPLILPAIKATIKGVKQSVSLSFTPT